MFRQSQIQASGRSKDDAIENSPKVHRELAEGIRTFPRWRKGVHWKKIETCRKIVGGSRKAYRELGRLQRDPRCRDRKSRRMVMRRSDGTDDYEINNHRAWRCANAHIDPIVSY
ncbi:hypothetical protein B296_00013306 [Ensete ventricosum]|uniref:Uncharacterized protein n=1 Tax=Ensete ventricosum TaxID=4639 RepID=A0A426YFV1_ENSVE|nr:hypothetical protein B296_00013306 [Ensete ventricosum]